MAFEKNLMTAEGKKELEKELKILINERRPNIIKQIQEAREQGDLSENADYDAAKNMQAQIEARIKEIENILANVKIISSLSEENVVQIGSTVTIKDFSDNKNYTFKIVGPIETDPADNKISNESPLARSIIGKKVGEEAYVKGIDEPYSVKIVNIKE